MSNSLLISRHGGWVSFEEGWDEQGRSVILVTVKGKKDDVRYAQVASIPAPKIKQLSKWINGLELSDR